MSMAEEHRFILPPNFMFICRSGFMKFLEHHDNNKVINNYTFQTHW